MERTLTCDHSLKAVVRYCGAVWFSMFFQFVILEYLSILDVALSGVKGLNGECLLETLLGR